MLQIAKAPIKSLVKPVATEWDRCKSERANDIRTSRKKEQCNGAERLDELASNALRPASDR